MKKLLFFMGCITALTCMTSCTADSIEDSKSNQISTPSADDPATLPGIDDKDRPKP